MDRLLALETFAGYNPALLGEIVRREIGRVREAIGRGELEQIDRNGLIEAIHQGYAEITTPSLRPLVNATGVIIHTNLGRSPIDPELFDKARTIATKYCNLEYDLKRGRRGDRYLHTAGVLRDLLGAGDVLILNNNAAAVFLILNTFAGGREAIVSRGELVEIGGSFRIPDVITASGARLREVGTTNKTRISDYEAAIGEQSAMLMKVHKSNYTIEGFSAESDMQEISALAQRHGLIDYYDMGSAYLPDLPWGLGETEPSILKLMEHPPALLSFSGDKLFGGVQAGIIVGRKELVAKLKKNQLMRMFRVDKITLSLLEQTAMAYRRRDYDRIPVLRMLSTGTEELERRAGALRNRLDWPSDIKSSRSCVGGGTMPNRHIPTVILALEGEAVKLESHFRRYGVIGRIESERFILDMRTVCEEDFDLIVAAAREWRGGCDAG